MEPCYKVILRYFINYFLNHPPIFYISGQQSNMSRMPTCVISVMTLEQSISEVIISWQRIDEISIMVPCFLRNIR